jgi:hypothetical protein
MLRLGKRTASYAVIVAVVLTEVSTMPVSAALTPAVGGSNYISMIRKAMTEDDSTTNCAKKEGTDGGPADGGPWCRSFKVVCLKPIGLQSADRLNGVFSKYYVHYNYAWFFAESWHTQDAEAIVIKTKSGTSVDRWGINELASCSRR